MRQNVVSDVYKDLNKNPKGLRATFIQARKIKRNSI